jgi:hypothetical protein
MTENQASQTPTTITDSQILKNAVEIIYHTGLLKNEVVKLKVADLKQNGSIVSIIQPVSGPYPKNLCKAPVVLSDEAHEILTNHINYLGSFLYFDSPQTPLFPNIKNRRAYDESKLWSFISPYCKYYSYERHREAGIHYLSWKLSNRGLSKQQIVEEVHKFSRLKNIKRTEVLVNEGTRTDPNEYNKFYSSCRSSAGFLINHIETWPDRAEQHRIKLENGLRKLYERDGKKILSDLNKKLFNYGKVLKVDDQSLKLTDYVPIITRKRR